MSTSRHVHTPPIKIIQSDDCNRRLPCLRQGLNLPHTRSLGWMGEQIGDNISWSVASPIFRLWAKWKLGRIIFTGFVSGQAEKEDSEEYSNAMVLFELDQLENLVHKQEELIGDLEARVQALEEVKVDSSAESFFVFSIQLTGYQICPSQNGFEQLTSGVGSSTN